MYYVKKYVDFVFGFCYTLCLISMEKGKQKTRRKNSEHYVDPVEFYGAMVEYRKTYYQAQKDNKPPPKVSDYIAISLMKIAQKLSNHQWFSGYNATIKEEMIADSLENCLKYLHNFNPRKSKNAFAYFSQIIWYAFRRRIDSEKAYLYTKYKIAENTMISHETVETGATPNEYCSEYSDDNMREFIDKFEESKRKKKEQADLKKQQNTKEKSKRKNKTKDLRKHLK